MEPTKGTYPEFIKCSLEDAMPLDNEEFDNALNGISNRSSSNEKIFVLTWQELGGTNAATISADPDDPDSVIIAKATKDFGYTPAPDEFEYEIIDSNHDSDTKRGYAITQDSRGHKSIDIWRSLDDEEPNWPHNTLKRFLRRKMFN